MPEFNEIDKDAFEQKYLAYEPYPTVDSWAVQAGTLIGVLSVLRAGGNDSDEVTWGYIDQLFGTMPIELHTRALAVVDLVQGQMDE